MQKSHDVRWRIVTFLIIAPYKYSYLLTYILTYLKNHITVFKSILRFSWLTFLWLIVQS